MPATGLTSLPEILREAGYHTAFFHNAENGSMGFDAFARKARFHEYYGQNEYGNLRDADPGGWAFGTNPSCNSSHERPLLSASPSS